MKSIDVTKCFDSIYTHSISWATLGKQSTKHEKAHDRLDGDFASAFDALMQRMNHNETNGIVIGPEFSRIFAEVILQAVDCMVHSRLESEFDCRHKVDYEAFRYVDDYFVFTDDEKICQTFKAVLADALRYFKLSINETKVKQYEWPVITEQTSAKLQISELFDEIVKVGLESDTGSSGLLVCQVNPSKLLSKYKMIIRDTHANGQDVITYCASLAESRIAKLAELFALSDRSARSRRAFVGGVTSILGFVYHAYVGSPRVSASIRLCRMIASAVDCIRDKCFSMEEKHALLKLIYDNNSLLLAKHRLDPFREVESLYILSATGHLGKDYWLTESALAKFFGIVESSRGFSRKSPLGYFAISVALNYMRNKSRFAALRAFIVSEAIRKVAAKGASWQLDAEATLIVLDIILCPFVDIGTKLTLGPATGLSEAEIRSIGQFSRSAQLFSAWGGRFDFARELESKRSREVY